MVLFVYKRPVGPNIVYNSNANDHPMHERGLLAF
jgi:hypothetical protein